MCRDFPTVRSAAENATCCVLLWGKVQRTGIDLDRFRATRMQFTANGGSLKLAAVKAVA